MQKKSLMGWFSGLWGLTGVIYLLSAAVLRVTPIVVEAVFKGLSLWQWVISLAWIAFMSYTEAYKGFQLAFSPRVGARVRWLSENPGLLRSLFAPFFCMGYFGANRKRTLVSIILTTSIFLIVVLVRSLPQPWRGIIDSGVVVGLGWGVLTVVWYGTQALFTPKEIADPELSKWFSRLGKSLN